VNSPHSADPSLPGLQLAAHYHAEHRGLALLVRRDGEVVFEHYASEHPPDQALPLASCTKSLTGLMLAAAVADGYLTLDEPVASTVPEWRSDPRKAEITARQLIQLTAGVRTERKAGQQVALDEALATPVTSPAGTRFGYNSASFQICAELLRRRLHPYCADPLDYLKGRVLDRIGVSVGRWRRGPDGNADFSAGAHLCARHWSNVGQLIADRGSWEGREVIPAALLDECFVGSRANPCYGLGWWLNATFHQDPTLAPLRNTLHSLGIENLAAEPAVPADLVYAAGAGKQRLYVSRRQRLVVVRQAAGVLEALAGGERSPYSDLEFWRRLGST